ncbi:Aste57867_24173 [Aphanomyces stellatus]|uniref:Aste57867_24173 protein n=1 Tax=Aphanomyces stellatus TaxID=120398 RepID=A0A485LPY3_9STRA|nr:hypothetical protein As57867_024099 [Aphanomyces stellatus]VFU00815.1 Aste57867_24173 [Aphanomyces stellatus]
MGAQSGRLSRHPVAMASSSRGTKQRNVSSSSAASSSIPTSTPKNQKAKRTIDMMLGVVDHHDPTSSFATVRYPCHSSTWIRGSPVCIQWTVLDSAVAAVRIELCQTGSSARTTLVATTPNTGCYVLERVPWGVLGDGFYIFVVEIKPRAAMASSASPRYIVSEKFSVATSRWHTDEPKPSRTSSSTVAADSCSSHGSATHP